MSKLKMEEVRKNIKKVLTYENLDFLLADKAADVEVEDYYRLIFKVKIGYVNYKIHVIDLEKHKEEYWTKENVEDFIQNIDEKFIDRTDLYSLEEITEMKKNKKLNWYQVEPIF